MSSKPRVLVVEDDTEIAGALRRSLRLEGYDVKLAEDGGAALRESSVFEPDAVVLDLGLPRLDGVEVARRLRDGGDVPILMLTARDSLEDRVSGLDSGADDYLVKPFEREELLARLRALLRRRPPRGSASLVVADLRLNPDTREVFRGERRIDLTTREFELLEYLMRNERLVVSRGVCDACGGRAAQRRAVARGRGRRGGARAPPPPRRKDAGRFFHHEPPS